MMRLVKGKERVFRIIAFEMQFYDNENSSVFLQSGNLYHSGVYGKTGVRHDFCIKG
jgi:hypothetical protein